MQSFLLRFFPDGHHSEGVKLIELIFGPYCQYRDSVHRVMLRSHEQGPEESWMVPEALFCFLFMSLCCHSQIFLLSRFSSSPLCLFFTLFNDHISLAALLVSKAGPVLRVQTSYILYLLTFKSSLQICLCTH